MSDKGFNPYVLNDRIDVPAKGPVLAEVVVAGFEKVDFDKIKPGDYVYVPGWTTIRTVTGARDIDGDYPLDMGYLLANLHESTGVWRHPEPSPTSVSPARHPSYTVARVHFRDGVAVCFMNTRGEWFSIGGDHLETEWDSPDVVAVHVLHSPVDNTEPTLTTLRDNPGRIAIQQNGLRWMYSEGDFWFWDDGDNQRIQSTIYRPHGYHMDGAVWADPTVTAPKRKFYEEEPRHQDRIEQREL